MDGVTDSIGRNLSKLRESEGQRACCSAWVTVRPDLATDQQPMYQAVCILGLLCGDTVVNKTATVSASMGLVSASMGLMDKSKTNKKIEK